MLIVLMSACAKPVSTYHPVTDDTPRQSTLGFSITPPPGVAWYERHNKESLYYLKKTRPKLYSISTKATEIHVDKVFHQKSDFHDYVKSRKALSQAPTRYRNIEFEFTDITELSPYCVRYENKYDDHGEQKSMGQPYVRVKKTGIFCMHPDFPLNGIDMFYQERSLSSSREPSFQKEGEQFLSSLQFQSTIN
ncbi:MAG: hypothetical protein EHM86_03410 [Desulfobulbaceae bacterium]|nr:MAG: hypothetical protein EHM86_03410 [Desulfobulbaceae bacterium]